MTIFRQRFYSKSRKSFRPMSDTYLKKLGKNVHSKCFPRNVAYNFSNPKKNSDSRKRAQYLRSLSEFQKTCSFPDKKQSYSKCLSGDIECSFDNRAKKLSQELKRVLLNVRKSVIEKSSFLQKNLLQLVIWKGSLQFRNFETKTSEERRNFPTQGPILIRQLFSSQKRDLFKNFLWTQKIQFKKHVEAPLPKGRKLVT